jgi:hypothetical protein
MSAASYALGPIVSGKVMSVKSISPVRAVKFVIFVNAFATAGFFIMGFMSCPKQEFAGNISLSG